MLPTPCPPLPPLDLIYPSKWGTLTSVKPDGVLSVLNVWSEWTHGKKIAFCKTAQIKAKKLSSEEQSQNSVLLTNPQPFLCEKFWKCCYYVLYVFSVILFSFVCRRSQETRTKILLKNTHSGVTWRPDLFGFTQFLTTLIPVWGSRYLCLKTKLGKKERYINTMACKSKRELSRSPRVRKLRITDYRMRKFFANGIGNPGLWNTKYRSRNQESH